MLWVCTFLPKHGRINFFIKDKYRPMVSQPSEKSKMSPTTRQQLSHNQTHAAHCTKIKQHANAKLITVFSLPADVTHLIISNLLHLCMWMMLRDLQALEVLLNNLISERDSLVAAVLRARTSRGPISGYNVFAAFICGDVACTSTIMLYKNASSDGSLLIINGRHNMPLDQPDKQCRHPSYVDSRCASN